MFVCVCIQDKLESNKAFSFSSLNCDMIQVLVNGTACWGQEAGTINHLG